MSWREHEMQIACECRIDKKRCEWKAWIESDERASISHVMSSIDDTQLSTAIECTSSQNGYEISGETMVPFLLYTRVALNDGAECVLRAQIEAPREKTMIMRCLGDLRWVNDALVPALTSGGFDVVASTHSSDDPAGKFIFVISPEFLASDEHVADLENAIRPDPCLLTRRLVPVLRGVSRRDVALPEDRCVRIAAVEEDGWRELRAACDWSLSEGQP